MNLGYYMNLQFTSAGSHRAAAEVPWKMERNFRFTGSRSATPLRYSVVNAGNIREHVMELSAYAAMMWDMESYDSDEFLRSFTSRYFGEAHADQIARLYCNYHDSCWQPTKPDLEDYPRQYLFHDYRASRATRILGCNVFGRFRENPFRDYRNDARFPGRSFRITPEDNGAANQVEAVVNGSVAAACRFAAVSEEAAGLMEELHPSVRPFFNENLLAPATFMSSMSEDLELPGRASLPETSFREKLRMVKQARQANRRAKEAMKSTNHGNFSDWDSHRGLWRLVY